MSKAGTLILRTEEFEVFLAALEGRDWLTEKLHTLSMSLSEVREDRERLRAALAAACDDLAAYIHDGYDGTSSLEGRLKVVAEHRAALEGRDG